MSEKNTATDFYNNFTGKLLKDFISGNPRTESAICFACEQLKKTKSANILDLGFGLGWSTHEYSRALPDAMITGVDLSSELTKLATVMFGDQSRISFQCQDLTEPDWAANQRKHYDASIMLDVYEHVPRAERVKFHQGLSSIMADDSMVILSCPTPIHQQYLREHKPAGLQPVDEDVTFEDLSILAKQIGGEIVHLEHKSIWATNDYFHAVISRKLTRSPVTELFLAHRLIGTAERVQRLEKSAGVVDPAAINQIKSCLPSLARRALNRLRNS